MGKSGKQTKVSHRHGRGRRVSHFGGDDGNDLPSSVYDAPPRYREDIDDGDSNEAAVEDEQEGDAEAGNQDQWQVGSMPSKFHLYQPSVQSPKGDISYLQKFFLMYVDGRVPLYLQEDFCGTALLCTEWLRTDARRTAIDLDLDLEALEWCLENNLNKIGADGYSRMLLFHGNVLHPKEARLVKKKYFWEQEDFDIMSHQTRISLHFLAGKKQMLWHAFTCHWRLWSIPEIKDCLEEAGFKSIHVWIREMPNTQSSGHAKAYDADRDVKYEELQHFNQGDAWNAYLVGVANI